ncbi:Lar family restriction alleviation protein [Anaerotruncus rubiinfantis]|uniref:Lar family restriction alleviation protein n=1 Tax=Anaerotruncus rubiinfantis TaxID=1720200 RepID=UPI003D79E3B6
MADLKPCPFCGSKAEYIERGNEHTGLKETSVHCTSCGTKQVHKWLKYKFDFDFVREKTIEAWNRRNRRKLPKTS